MTAIKNYNLYGEESNFPDVIHCETIEVRSLIHDWEFAPHRHLQLHQFVLVETGGGSIVLETQRQKLLPGHLVNIPAGTVHGFSFLPETNGWVVTLATELLEQGLNVAEGLRGIINTVAMVTFGQDIKRIVEAIFAEFPRRSFARAHVLRALAGVLIGLVARRLENQSPQNSQAGHALLAKFDKLLEEHFLSHMSVSQYAEMLGVTPTHLSRILRHELGQSTAAIIEERLIREARRYLAFSNMRISEIAYQLGFEDPAYFSRTFKRATGDSPRSFRQSLAS